MPSISGAPGSTCTCWGTKPRTRSRAPVCLSGPDDWDFAAPSRAGYVQLPHYLFWARPEAGGPAEALDGFFWVLTPAHRLHLMVASGMRADRPGLGVMPVPEIPGEEASRWAAVNVRERGDDFASTLPGGEDLCSIETLGEVVKLAGRLFWQLERGLLRAPAPTKGGEAGSGPSEGASDPGSSSRAPLASTLPWRLHTRGGAMTRSAAPGGVRADAPRNRGGAMRESVKARKERAARIYDLLVECYPDAHCALHHRNPYELAVATILSAQCTDERVNKVTPALFERYPEALDLAGRPPGRTRAAHPFHRLLPQQGKEPDRHGDGSCGNSTETSCRAT